MKKLITNHFDEDAEWRNNIDDKVKEISKAEKDTGWLGKKVELWELVNKEKPKPPRPFNLLLQ